MSFKLFLLRLPDFEGIKKYAKRTNRLCNVECSSLIELPFIVLKRDLPNLIKDGEYEKAILLVLRCFDKRVTLSNVIKEDNFNKTMFLFWIFDEFEKINKMEREYLSGAVSKKLRNAGIDRLNVLGYFNTIDAIAKEYGYKHSEAARLKYSLIFDIQYRNKILTEIHNELIEN